MLRKKNSNYLQVASAIRSMVVRGAPAIGITAAYGMAIAQKKGEDLEEAYRVLADSRPTAVNLKWALDKVNGFLELIFEPWPVSD